MAGLIAIFNANGATTPISGLVRAFPSHAERRDEWCDPHCAVARLHHETMAKASQPIWNRTGTVALFCDGGILLDGPANSSTGDVDEPASAAWRRLIDDDRPEALADLNGSFALIIYDARRREIRLVSDRHGSRPLYYFVTGSEMVVASHVAALTAHPRCPKGLDRQALHELVAFQRVLGTNTIYRDVHRVDAASVVRFDGRSVTSRAYWELRWRQPSFSKQEAPAILADALRRAVRRRLGPGRRGGLLLSGGLDSRAILAAAETPLVCFTQAAAENRDVEIARAAAGLCGAEFHFLQVDPSRYSDRFEEAVRLTGGMQRGHACVFLPVLETVKQYCDVLFVGYGFNTIYRGHQLPKPKLVFDQKVIPLPVLKRIAKTGLLETVFRSLVFALPEAAVHRALTPEAEREHGDRLRQSVAQVISGFRHIQESSLHNVWDYFNVRSVGLDGAFPNVLSIRSWMDDGVVALDRDLFELYLQMPPEWRHPDVVYVKALRHLMSRDLQRLSLVDTGLPASADPRLIIPLRTIVQGMKRRSSSPRRQASWPSYRKLLRQPGPFHDRLRRLPGSEALLSCGIFDRSGLQTLADEHLSGRRDHSRLLMMLLTIDSWVEQFGAEAAA